MREKQKHQIEVHVAGICFRETENNLEVLIVKRNDDRELYPEKWECGGGQVNSGENFEEAIKRQMKEELGVIVEKVLPFSVYEIKTLSLEQKKIPGIKFVCFWKSYADGSNEPKIDPAEHSKFLWVSINDLGNVDFIDGIADDIRQAWEYYSTYKNAII
jgi:8-oxo-dGTP pyrophosphatase MutT (NUDIX family)